MGGSPHQSSAGHLHPLHVVEGPAVELHPALVANVSRSQGNQLIGLPAAARTAGHLCRDKTGSRERISHGSRNKAASSRRANVHSRPDEGSFDSQKLIPRDPLLVSSMGPDSDQVDQSCLLRLAAALQGLWEGSFLPGSGAGIEPGASRMPSRGSPPGAGISPLSNMKAATVLMQSW